MFRPLEAIIRSRSGYPKVGEKFGWQRCRKGSLEDRDLVLTCMELLFIITRSGNIRVYVNEGTVDLVHCMNLI